MRKPSSPVERKGLHSRRVVEVTWGDCDASGMVFYPRYYQWFDACTHTMLSAVGLDHHELRRAYGVIGASLVEASARFRSPATYGEALPVDSRVTRVGERSFTVGHTITVAERLVVEGEEVRVWAARVSEALADLRAVPIPLDVRALLEGERGRAVAPSGGLSP